MAVNPNSLKNLSKGRIKLGEVRNPGGRGAAEKIGREFFLEKDAEKLKNLFIHHYGIAMSQGPNATASAKMLLDRAFCQPGQDVSFNEGQGLIIHVINPFTEEKQ